MKRREQAKAAARALSYLNKKIISDLRSLIPLATKLHEIKESLLLTLNICKISYFPKMIRNSTLAGTPKTDKRMSHDRY